LEALDEWKCGVLFTSSFRWPEDLGWLDDPLTGQHCKSTFSSKPLQLTVLLVTALEATAVSSKRFPDPLPYLNQGLPLSPHNLFRVVNLPPLLTACLGLMLSGADAISEDSTPLYMSLLLLLIVFMGMFLPHSH
jgi:hypothetical protein